MKIGELINSYRRIRNKTLKEVATETGVSITTLSRIEKGEKCDSDILAKLFVWAFS